MGHICENAVSTDGIIVTVHTKLENGDPPMDKVIGNADNVAVRDADKAALRDATNESAVTVVHTTAMDRSGHGLDGTSDAFTDKRISGSKRGSISSGPTPKTSYDRSRKRGSLIDLRRGSYIDARGSTEAIGDAVIVEKLASIPIHVRGRTEAWEIPRAQLALSTRLGAGAGSVVYRCRWRGLICAAKLLSERRNTRDSIVYLEMVNEIGIVSRLRHPNLVLFLGACTTSGAADDPLIIVSEFMAGGSLEDRFEAMASSASPHFGSFQESFRAIGMQPAAWRPPVALAVSWISDLSKAVAYLHSCTIIHRDLKPANLLLTGEDHLKVSDFGLCKTLRKVRDDGTPYQMTGNTGTKRYMAPEVVASNPQYDEKVDIYSMAMIFWYIFTGTRPFDAVSPNLIADLTAYRGARPPAPAVGWPALADLIDRMWAHAPADRPAAAEIVDVLAGMRHPAQRGGGGGGGGPGGVPRCAACALQ